MPKEKSGFSLDKLKFNKGDMEVLKKLYIYEYGLGQKELVKKTALTLGGVSKILKKLRRFGLLYYVPKEIFIYRIIPERRREIELILKAYKKGKIQKNLFSCHAYVIECLVNELPKVFLEKITKSDGWIEYIPKNWIGYKLAYIDATVKFHKTNKQCKAYFFFRTIADDPHIAEMINIEKFLEKKTLLETKYPGLKIGDPTTIGFQNYCEVSWLREPIAVEAIKLGLKHKCVEDSYGVGGEWEEKGIDAVDKIKRIFKLRDLITKISDKEFRKVMEFIKSLLSQDTI